MDEQSIERLARAIYSEVYGHLDDKHHWAATVAEIRDWLSDGDGGEGASLAELVADWREYASED